MTSGSLLFQDPMAPQPQRRLRHGVLLWPATSPAEAQARSTLSSYLGTCESLRLQVLRGSRGDTSMGVKSGTVSLCVGEVHRSGHARLVANNACCVPLSR